jgi:molybdopterin/thiamine biosynthesis adenylyltransferase
MEIKIERFLQENSSDNFITISTCKKASSKYELSYHEVEKIALQNGLLPLRYKRNQTTISFENQLKLLNAHVAIIGCGGLGGHIAENLARLGVGNLRLFDFDVFEEHNLNRQNFSHFGVLGKEKALVVKEGCERINPALHVKAFVQKFDVQKDFGLIEDCDVIIDALDDPQIKLELSFTCKDKKKDFIHGAIAGFNTQHASCISLEHLYKNGSKGIETSVGNPAFTVSFAASLQSLECVKLILGLKENLEGKILLCNLLENEFILLDN